MTITQETGLGLLLGLLAMPLLASPGRAPLVLPPLAREELAAAPLASGVFAAARADYADLRVLDEAGHKVPFLIETLTAPHRSAVRRDCAVLAPQARETGANALELTFALAPDVPPPTGLAIDTPLRDFQQRVKVEGAAADGPWQVLADGAVIYDLSRFISVRQNEVAWAPAACRQFRVTLLDAATDRASDMREVTTGTAGSSVRQNVRHEPFRVDRLRFWRLETVEDGREPVLAEYPLTRVAATTQATGSMFVFRSAREPLTRITFATTNRLFQRTFRLYGRDAITDVEEDAPGRLLASGGLTHLRFQNISRTDMTVAFPATRCREYVLVCDGASDEPADVTAAKAEGLTPRVILAASPDKSYMLAFGEARDAQNAMPDAAAIRSLLDSGCRPVEARLGPVTAVAETAHRRTWRAWLNSSWAMTGAMAVAGLLLAWVLVKAFRKLG